MNRIVLRVMHTPMLNSITFHGPLDNKCFEIYVIVMNNIITNQILGFEKENVKILRVFNSQEITCQ